MEALPPGKEFAAQSMLDAGDTDWPILRELIARRVEELASGAVLEVASLAPGHGVQLLSWCIETGCDFSHVSGDGERNWFWIKKR